MSLRATKAVLPVWIKIILFLKVSPENSMPWVHAV